jgi:imidazole glycerol phosphate synthase subunit HisF
MGLVRESGGMLWNMVPASRWARNMHRSVGGEVLLVMMDSVGQFVYVVEMV